MADYIRKLFVLIVMLVSLQTSCSDSLPAVASTCRILCEDKPQDTIEKELSLPGCIQECVRQVIKLSTEGGHLGDSETASGESRDKRRENRYLRIGRASLDSSSLEEGSPRRPHYLRIGRSDSDEKRASKYLRMGRSFDEESLIGDDENDAITKRDPSQRNRQQYLRIGKRS